MSDDTPQNAPEAIQDIIAEPNREESGEIKLSQYTQALIDSIKSIKSRPAPDDLSKLSVSQTVTFLAIGYEKVRNAVEYREEHLVLRAVIERILKRRLALNAEGKGEAENLLRELTWARYFPNESLGDNDIDDVQKIIDRYLNIKNELISHAPQNQHVHLFQFVFDLLTCEIEETLNSTTAKKMASYTYFIFQTLKGKIKVEGLEEDKKDAFFLVALDKAYRKSDTPYLRYHLFTTFYEPLSELSEDEAKNLTHKLPEIFKKIDSMIKNPYVDSLTKFIKKQLPPFLILFEIFDKHPRDVSSILTDREQLRAEVEETCNAKYAQVGSRLRSLAFRSLIYIFITKMLFALILEYPVSMFLYGEAHTTSILINTLFPPALMLFIVLFFKLPKGDNTRAIYERIVHLVDFDRTFETQVSYMRKKMAERRPILIFIFTILYSFTFFITLYLIHQILTQLHFNLISEALFIFFISVVSFFSYRIKQVVNEYTLREREGALGPVIDVFFMPILSLGKFFSREISKINVFIVIFDFIIEAPFKLIIETFEEWIKFVRARKEEIV